jgi:hypothetical protein
MHRQLRRGGRGRDELLANAHQDDLAGLLLLGDLVGGGHGGGEGAGLLLDPLGDAGGVPGALEVARELAIDKVLEGGVALDLKLAGHLGLDGGVDLCGGGGRMGAAAQALGGLQLDEGAR